MAVVGYGHDAAAFREAPPGVLLLTIAEMVLLALSLRSELDIWLPRVSEDQDHERERRFLSDAITASIAHELRQPLAAILLNAQAALAQSEGRSAGASEVLNEIIACLHRLPLLPAWDQSGKL